ncbi:MAG: hypothetical protein KDJ35_03680 [Alphaproteobacteria bacterium]|nr:hypothetical protein [Alphaproteobacteria bacterium]
MQSEPLPLRQYDPSVSSEIAGRVAADILNSPEVDRLWGLYHASEADENPAHDIANEIKKLGSDLQGNPALLAFMRELVKIERRALGDSKKTDSQEDKILKKSMEGLQNFLDLLAMDVKLPKTKKLPQNYKALLGTLKHHTAQNAWGPVHTMRKILKETAHHVWEEVKEKPYSSAFMTSVAVGALWFMNTKLGSSVTNYIDPEMMTATNFSLDALGDPNYQAEVDPSFYSLDTQISCHNHIKSLLDGFVNESTAQSLAETPAVQLFFPNHCDRYKTLLPDAQNILQTSYDWWNSRIAAFSENPTASFSEHVVPDSPFKQAFDSAAHNTAEFFYAANTVENFVFHSLVTFAGCMIAFKIGTLKNEETSEHLNQIKDFAKRSWANSKLSYIFTAAGATGAYMAHDGFTPWMVILGLAGMSAGEISHRVARKYNKHHFAKKSLSSSAAHSARFSDPSAIVTNTRAGEDLVRSSFLQKAWKNKRGLTIAAGLGTILATDMAVNNGVLTGYLTGGGTVTSLFAGFNAVEDTAAHIIFGLVGGVVGLIAAGIKRGTIGTIKVSAKALKPLGRQVKYVARYIKQRFATKTQPSERFSNAKEAHGSSSNYDTLKNALDDNIEAFENAKQQLECDFENASKCGAKAVECPLVEVCRKHIPASALH